jgi:trehalose 2-sulfotransferase
VNEHVTLLQNAFAPYFDARHETDGQYASMPEPRRDFVIFMTPRSGSTWLSQILIRHGGFGQPEEWFNPDHIAIDIDQTRSASLDRYLKHVRKRFKDARTGVFGAEVSFFHLELMERMAGFFDVFDSGHTTFFYLTRRDLAAQAVSLYKATKTQIWNSLDGDVSSKDFELAYDEAEVIAWAEHLLMQEDGFERTFAALKLRPIRIAYEDIIEAGAEKVCQFFCRHVGVDFHAAPAERMKKIGTAKNEEFAERFASSLNLQWLRNRRVDCPVWEQQ